MKYLGIFAVIIVCLSLFYWLNPNEEHSLSYNQPYDDHSTKNGIPEKLNTVNPSTSKPLEQARDQKPSNKQTSNTTLTQKVGMSFSSSQDMFKNIKPKEGASPIMGISFDEKELAAMNIGDSINLPLSELPFGEDVPMKEMMDGTELVISDKIENEDGSVQLKADISYFMGIGSLELTITNQSQSEGTITLGDDGFSVNLETQKGQGYIYMSQTKSPSNSYQKETVQ